MRRLAAGLAVSLFAAGLVACGGGDGGGETASSAGSATAPQRAEATPEVKRRNEEVRREYKERKQTAAPSEDEREAEQAVAGFYAILDEDEAEASRDRTAIDSTSFCNLMSEEAVAQTIQYAKVASGIARKWDCESAVEMLVVRSKRTGGFEQAQAAEVIGVEAHGDRAIATVRFGGGTATAVPLVKEDGEWKLAANAVPSSK